jgi:hypothetical protein
MNDRVYINWDGYLLYVEMNNFCVDYYLNFLNGEIQGQFENEDELNEVVESLGWERIE